MALTSAPTPSVFTASYTQSSRDVFFTLSMMVALSIGRIVLKSTTSMSMPSAASVSAASSALCTMIEVATMVRSLPSRRTSALPIGTV